MCGIVGAVSPKNIVPILEAYGEAVMPPRTGKPANIDRRAKRIRRPVIIGCAGL